MIVIYFVQWLKDSVHCIWSTITWSLQLINKSDCHIIIISKYQYCTIIFRNDCTIFFIVQSFYKIIVQYRVFFNHWYCTIIFKLEIIHIFSTIGKNMRSIIFYNDCLIHFESPPWFATNLRSRNSTNYFRSQISKK